MYASRGHAVSKRNTRPTNPVPPQAELVPWQKLLPRPSLVGLSLVGRITTSLSRYNCSKIAVLSTKTWIYQLLIEFIAIKRSRNGIEECPIDTSLTGRETAVEKRKRRRKEKKGKTREMRDESFNPSRLVSVAPGEGNVAKERRSPVSRVLAIDPGRRPPVELTPGRRVRQSGQ